MTKRKNCIFTVRTCVYGHATKTRTATFATSNTGGTINSTGPVTVVCVKDINLGGGKTLTLSGSASDIFVVNITGSISMGGGNRIRASGLPPSNVLYNVIGAGQNIVIGGASVVDGALLTIGRNLDLSAGFVNGSVTSKGNINIGSGEQIPCPCPTKE